jgi:glucose-6-phosphate 1-dehydrogenase
LIIFGGTGDLTHRKLIPALFQLHIKGLLPKSFPIVLIGRQSKSQGEYINELLKSTEKYSRNGSGEDWESFSKRVNYYQMDISKAKDYKKLKSFLEKEESRWDTKGNRLYYLAVLPDKFDVIVTNLKEFGFTNLKSSWQRVVIEKPFGEDLESAKRLNKTISEVFNEENIFRIDHYLGKEMIQNILIIRYANTIFEPLWNNKYIDNIQIVVSEEEGVGTRGAFYEKTGALRDMVQNHILQLVALTAMNLPSKLSTESIREEKVRILKKLEPINKDRIRDDMVLGQYSSYREEKNISEGSLTETFVALKLLINNIRWKGVPFYIMTGKGLKSKSAQVFIQFKKPEEIKDGIFSNTKPNLLEIKIQPEEGVYLRFNAKKPITLDEITSVKMDFCQSCQYQYNTPEAYEKLIYDFIEGDSSRFTRWDEVEYSWKFIDTINSTIVNREESLEVYEVGSDGPKGLRNMLEKGGRMWWHLSL